jgi:hypothetical protein
MGTITDSTNQANGMSVLALSWGLGSCVGPLLGGFLASPVDLYPSYFDPGGLFGQLPFLLPCLSITGMCVVAFVATLLLLPPDIDTQQCCGESTRRYVKVDTHGADRDAECSDQDDADDFDEPELMTWKTILCRKSTLTACLAYVHTSCIYIVYGKILRNDACSS